MTVHVALGGASGSSAVPDFVHPARTARPELSSAESGLDAVADAIAKARRIVVVSGELLCGLELERYGLFSDIGWNLSVSAGTLTWGVKRRGD